MIPIFMIKLSPGLESVMSSRVLLTNLGQSATFWCFNDKVKGNQDKMCVASFSFKGLKSHSIMGMASLLHHLLQTVLAVLAA